MVHRSIILVLFWVGCLGLGRNAAWGAEWPTAGTPVPELARFDALMLEFLRTNDIGAGALGMMHQGRVVFDRAYGWQDMERRVPIRADVVMRVASLTKPVTAAAIHQLIAQGKLSLESKVFSLGRVGLGVLDYQAIGAPDPRLGDITIKNLLEHRGGWDRDAAGDLTYREREIAEALGVSCPPSRGDTVRWIMGQPLQHDPGAKYAYSNIGYLLLGLIVEKLSGKDYLDFVHEFVFAGTPVTRSDLFLGRTFREDQDRREPIYDEPERRLNVFYPAHHQARMVPGAYGAWNHEARTGQGRIVASTRAYLYFMSRYVIAGDTIGQPKPDDGAWTRNHTGGLPGTSTLARQRGDGIHYAVFFNKRPTNGPSYAVMMREAIDAVLDGGEIEKWP